MKTTQFANSVRSHSVRSLKEKTSGTDGISGVLMSVLPASVHSQNTWNGRERTGTDGTSKPKTGLFFHSIGADGEIENQGHLLELTSNGFGKAQLFEWFFGEPSTIICVTPDYLATCIFYTGASAMNAAYAASEVPHD